MVSSDKRLTSRVRKSEQVPRSGFLICLCSLCLLTIACMLWSANAYAQFVVMDARGVAFKPGDKIAAGTNVALKEGERLSVIGADGKSITLRGPYTGQLAAASGGAARCRPVT